MDPNASAQLVRRRRHQLTQQTGGLLVGIQTDCGRDRRAATLWIDVDPNLLRRCASCCKRQTRELAVSIGDIGECKVGSGRPRVHRYALSRIFNIEHSNQRRTARGRKRKNANGARSERVDRQVEEIRD